MRMAARWKKQFHADSDAVNKRMAGAVLIISKAGQVSLIKIRKVSEPVLMQRTAGSEARCFVNIYSALFDGGETVN
jgi:hypothetical protein